MVELAGAGTSATAIAHHYDLSDEFFRLWLGSDLVYSCAFWDPAGPHESLARAQRRKIDYFADRLQVRGGHLLDVGCGWGGLLERAAVTHRIASGVGLTLSGAQEIAARARDVIEVDIRRESWVDHIPVRRYDAITAIESTEHFACATLTADEKVEVYRAFFDRCASWLRDDGRLGLQLICLDAVGHNGSRLGRGPLGDLIGTEIFPESMPSSLSEMVLAWETHFELAEFLDHTDHYRRTFRSWALAYRQHAALARSLVGGDVARLFARYFAAGEVCFATREHALYRVVLVKRSRPKQWTTLLTPGTVARLRHPPTDPAGAVASAAAVRSHYDVSNDFYRLWLGPSMMYSSGLWGSDDHPDLEAAHDRKIDFFASRVLPAGCGYRPDGSRGRAESAAPRSVLDVGCGWSYTLRRFVERGVASDAVGLTLSPAQKALVTADPLPSIDVRLESWTEHQPVQPYDAIVSFGAFEHFARDGSDSAARVSAYRAFFARCHEWLAPGGRLGLETIAHDGAPDTAAPLGRGPLGNFVLGLFPESICPHLGEVVLGFEPWFEVEVLRADGGDFARTFRAWQVRLRRAEPEATAEVGRDTVRRFLRYLAASEVQFRTGALTNYRFVLRSRPVVKR